MKIGFDGKRASQNLTGLGNYSRYVIHLLKKFHAENRYSIYALKNPNESLLITGVDYKYPLRQSFKAFWRSYGIKKNLIEDKVDLYHGLSNEIPYGLGKGGISTVVTIHDLIFIRFPQYYRLIDRIIYRIKVKYAIAKADRIIAISNQTKRDLIEYFRVEEAQITVIYQNCDPIFRQQLRQEYKFAIRQKYDLPENYLLSVGTIEERKNLMLLVQAVNELEDVHLVVVGRETNYIKKVKAYIQQNKLNERVHFLKNVSYIDLPAIYQQADIFFYPSRFEGFGIPILEALHSGVPVIAATGSCLEEAGGSGSIYVDPDDWKGLAEQIKLINGNANRKETMVQAGYLHLKNFDDQKIAREINQLYKDVVNHA